MADDLVERLRAVQHCSDRPYAASVAHDATIRIEALERDLEQSRSVEETTHGLYLFWQKKAQELAMSNDALRAQLDEARKQAFEEAAQIAEKRYEIWNAGDDITDAEGLPAVSCDVSACENIAAAIRQRGESE